MEKEKKVYRAHCIVLAYPIQGHLNPMLQFSKRLENKGVKVTLVTTRFISKSIIPTSSSSTAIDLETISDGYDEGGNEQAESVHVYLNRFREVGSRTLSSLVERLNGSSAYPIDCIVYDAFLPWCLDVAKDLGLVGAVFFTQSCAVDTIYYHVNQGLIKVPVTEDEIFVPGLPPLRPRDLPSFVYDFGSYPTAFNMLVTSQFSNIDKADWVLCNSVYELENELVDWLSKLWPLRTIGPTVPSMYLDKQLEDDRDYGFSIFKPNHEACLNWLNERHKGSVAYVSFGSLAALGEEQMEELSAGLKRSNCYFLWVVRESEESKLPKDHVNEKGLIVSWCHELEVLSHESVGCFVTHCGWNSTLEALSLGVPMVAMPQWTDQNTNAKYITDVWKMGIRARADGDGIVQREAVEHCVREVMEGERGREVRRSGEKWRKLVREAVDFGNVTNNKYVAIAILNVFSPITDNETELLLSNVSCGTKYQSSRTKICV